MNNNAEKQILELTSSPHISSGYSVDVIMRNVVYALLPVTVFSIYCYGLVAVAVLLTAVLSCLATEYVLARKIHNTMTLGDWSVVITGLIYGLTLPPSLPLWMVCVGGVISVSLGKFLFGGLGSNLFNPALVGRLFLQSAFPVSMTTWWPAFLGHRFTSLPASTVTLPFIAPVYDVQTGATPLAHLKFDGVTTDVLDLFFGFTHGSLGESSALLILLGGVYLVMRNMMNWRIPLGVFLVVIVVSAVFKLMGSQLYGQPLVMLFSGGLMLGAVFMATDMVASPVTNMGCFVYGTFIGAMIMVMRYWGGMPESVMYAILLGNAVSPLIDRFIQPVPFGAPKL